MHSLPQPSSLSQFLRHVWLVNDGIMYLLLSRLSAMKEIDDRLHSNELNCVLPTKLNKLE
uniref:Uncharacterized protein n=1 Tax=Populus trichocarpa x Populus deltoides TaxID=3695 RepID=A9PJI2_9ROSI|nr:unknown [Populus trichocarpa x Populus deltoides]